ncbi:Tc5 transposase DNA-binding domain [Popillia japonica]|uniref:Tc5 transposase DNA-binding domain n=1 Tax=Popillia japonica TaxID=7064 RepID=A0AAW1K0D2_POPJA
MTSISDISHKITKRKRTKLSLALKSCIIEALDRGEKICNIARLHNLNQSTVCGIKHNANTIKKSIKEVPPNNLECAKYYRSSTVLRMEKLLVEWITVNNNQNISMDTRSIQNQALLIFNELNSIDYDNDIDKKKPTFVASKGWFDKFKKRYKLHNIKFLDESINANGDIKTEIVHTFHHVNNDLELNTEIFNEDPVEAFLNSIPIRTFTSEEDFETPIDTLDEVFDEDPFEAFLKSIPIRTLVDTSVSSLDKEDFETPIDTFKHPLFLIEIPIIVTNENYE